MLQTTVASPEQLEQPFDGTNTGLLKTGTGGLPLGKTASKKIASKTMPQQFEADTLGENNHDTLGHNNIFDDDDGNDQFHRMQRVLRTA